MFAATHLDPLIGLDVHIVQPPPPAPPVPVPHPHTGIIFDPFDYLPIVGSTVKINGLHRALGGTVGVTLPSHVPIGGLFVKPPANDSEVLLGSSTVRGDGEVMSHFGLPSLSCWDVGLPPIPRLKMRKRRLSLSMPTTFVLASPKPVRVGGPPTVSVMAFVMRGFFIALRRLGRRAQILRRLLRRQNRRCASGLDPVDFVSGAVFDSFVDAKRGPFQWERHYSTARSAEPGPLGWGFRHGYQIELSAFRQGFELRTPTGERHLFPRLKAVGESVAAHGYQITWNALDQFELADGDRTWVFERSAGTPRTTLRRVDANSSSLEFEYADGRLSRIREGARSYHLEHDALGRILAVRDELGQVLAAYQYDSSGNLVRSCDGAGGNYRFVHDTDHRWIEKIDPRGYRYSYRYDDFGRCVEGSGEDGRWSGTLRYAPAARTTYVTQGGGEWAYRYDERETIVEIVDPMGGVQRRILDPQGRVIAEVDAAGRSTSWVYDERDTHVASIHPYGHELPPDHDVEEDGHPLEHRPLETAREWAHGKSWREEGTSPWAEQKVDYLGRVRALIDRTRVSCTFDYDTAGNVSAYTDRDGRKRTYCITSWNLIGAEIDPLGHVTSYDYGLNASVTKVLDPGGTRSDYDYDAKDRLVRIVRNGRIREEYEYDAGDQLIEKRDATGAALLRLEYGADQLIKRRHLTSGDVHSFEHDIRGRVTAASTTAHEVRLSHHPSGSIESDERDGRGVHHDFVREHSRKTRVLDRFRMSYELDVTTGTRRVVDPTGAIHRVDERATNRIERMFANGSSDAAMFDSEGRLVSHERPGLTTRYRYTPEGDLLAIETDDGASVRYHWDAAHRLVGEDCASGTFRYNYDVAGNLTHHEGLAISITDANRIEYAGAERFSYDHRDHVSERSCPRGTKTNYVYDSCDQLISIVDSHREERWTASYDGLGRRIRAGFGTQQREFVWDGDRLAAEIAVDGQLRIYVYPDIAAVVPMAFVDYDSIDADPATGRFYSLTTNNVGMPIRVEDSAGKLAWSVRRVHPYGAVEIDESSSIELNLRWPGHYCDPETGLHYNRYRYYDPKLARYLQSDPAGTAGGLNLYAYVADPVSNVDLFGLSRCGSLWNSVWSRIGSSRIAESVRRAGRVWRTALRMFRRPSFVLQGVADQFRGLFARAPFRAGTGSCLPFNQTLLQQQLRFLIEHSYGADVAQMVDRSPTLQRQLETLSQARRGLLSPVGYNYTAIPNSGSYHDGVNQHINIDPSYTAEQRFRALAHEVGHGTYTMPPQVPRNGLTPRQYEDLNVRRHLDDEGQAIHNEYDAMREVAENGGPVMRGHGPYDAIYNREASGRLTRDQSIREMGELQRRQVTSTTGEYYHDYYGRPYRTP